jgi:hypothetical protein
MFVRFAPVIMTIVPAAAVMGENENILGALIRLKPPREAVPPCVATEIVPPVVPTGTVARICVGEITVTLAAATPPKVTVEVVVKFVPVITIVVPTPAFVGEKLIIVGMEINVNPAKFPVPPGVVTDTAPPNVPEATTAVIRVAETITKLDAATPPKLTAVAPVKFVPLMVTVAPAPTLVGVKLVTVGGGISTKPARLPVPPGVVTETLPLAPVATTAVICVGETTVKLAAVTPPKRTELAPLKFVPVRLTVIPVPALAGVKLVIVGGEINVKPCSEAVPVCVEMETAPSAPEASVATICVAETTVKLAAAVPPKLTPLTPTKFVPTIVMVIPAPALVGVNRVMVGDGAT